MLAKEGMKKIRVRECYHVVLSNMVTRKIWPFANSSNEVSLDVYIVYLFVCSFFDLEYLFG